MYHRGIGVLVGVVVASVLSPAGAQQGAYLDARLDAQLRQTRKAAQELLNSLLTEPADVRRAALLLSQHPADLFGLANGTTAQAASPAQTGLEPVSGITARGGSAAVREAVQRLAGQPDLVEMLCRNASATALLGEVYAAQPEVVGDLVDAVALQASQRREASTSAWEERLKASEAAGRQLSEALSEMARLSSGAANALARGETAPSSGLPSAGLIEFVLVHADRYPDLAAAIIGQWAREWNPDSFRRPIDLWYARHRELLPWTFARPTEWLASLVKELALFEKDYARAAAESEGVGLTRLEYLNARLPSYSTLAGVRHEKMLAVARSREPEVVGAPWTSGGGGGSSGSSRSSSSARSRSTSNRSSTRTNRAASTSQGGGRFGRSGNGGNNGGDSGGFGGGGFGGGGFGGGGFGGGTSGFGSGGSGFGGSSGFGSNRSRIGGSNRSNNN